MQIPGPGEGAIQQSWAWIRRPLEVLRGARAQYGSRFALRFLGDKTFAIVSDPEDVRAVFTAPPEVLVSGNEGMLPFFGKGSMFVVNGAEHKRHRKLVGPTMRGESLDAYRPILDRLVAEMVSEWPVGETFPIEARLRQLALDAICYVMFGVSNAERRRELQRSIFQMTEGVGARLVFIPKLRVDMGRFSPWGGFLRARSSFRSILAREIEETKANVGERSDVLARLVAEGAREGDPFDDDDIHAELLTLLSAGHETTTTAVAWAFQWILGDPAIRARLTEELRAHPADKRADENAYVSAVISETLRIMPPTPIVPRRVGARFALGDIEVPTGTYIAPSPYLTHHDPALYSDPERFDPERFMGKRPRPFEFYPYGGGGRACIGGAFANFEMAEILRSIVRRVDLELVGDREQRAVRRGVVMVPHGGTPVRLLTPPRTSP